jgi:hypothetical protein
VVVSVALTVLQRFDTGAGVGERVAAQLAWFADALQRDVETQEAACTSLLSFVSEALDRV